MNKKEIMELIKDKRRQCAEEYVGYQTGRNEETENSKEFISVVARFQLLDELVREIEEA